MNLFKRSQLPTLSLLLALALSLLSQAEEVATSQTFDDYEIHYSVFNTSFLTPQVAEAYGIVRSKSKAMMNISVLQKQADGTMKPVSALVSGEQFDLIRHTPLNFQQVREESAIYYLSSFDIQHRATVYFTVNIQPDPAKSAYELKFSKILYRDE